MRNLLLLVLIGFLMACEGFFRSEIEIDLPEHEPLLVLNSLITPSDTLRIMLTKSQDILSNDPVNIYVPNAQIELVRNGEVVDGAFFVNTQFQYVSPSVFPQPGDEFEITVSVAGFPEVSATATVPRPAALFSAEEMGVRVVFDGADRKIIRFEMEEDLPEQNNYYEVVIAQVTDYESSERIGYEDFFFETSISWQEITLHGVAFTGEAISGKTSVEIEAFQQAYYGESTYFLELRSVSKDYYEYVTTLAAHIENQQQELFSGEPVPMFSNVEGGYGLVGAYSAAQLELELSRDF
jgi:hypothetical protein